MRASWFVCDCAIFRNAGATAAATAERAGPLEENLSKLPATLREVRLTRLSYADSVSGAGWLVALPRQSSVAPDELATVGTLCVDASGLPAGTYRITPRATLVDGQRYVGRSDPRQVRVRAGAVGEATVEYRLLDFLDNPATGNYSSRAANAALCVAEGSPEDYNSFVAQVFAAYTGEGMSDDDLKSMASGLGADVNGCIDGNTYRPFVKYTGATARADGVTGTPTVFVNGQNWAESAQEGQTFTDWAQSVMEKKS